MYKLSILDIRKTLNGLTLPFMEESRYLTRHKMIIKDFELPIDDANDLVAKILQYAGVSIREKDVFQFGKLEEQQLDNQIYNYGIYKSKSILYKRWCNPTNNNWGSYQFTSLKDIVNNFLLMYQETMS